MIINHISKIKACHNTKCLGNQEQRTLLSIFAPETPTDT